MTPIGRMPDPKPKPIEPEAGSAWLLVVVAIVAFVATIVWAMR